MKRATMLQAAAVVALVGLVFVLLSSGGTAHRENPSPVFTLRPATEAERQQHDAELLYERLLRQQEAAPLTRPATVRA